jgi:hypothetical protein
MVESTEMPQSISPAASAEAWTCCSRRSHVPGPAAAPGQADRARTGHVAHAVDHLADPGGCRCVDLARVLRTRETVVFPTPAA